MEASFFTLGKLLVDALCLAAFALTFRWFWKARPRPTPALVPWTYVAFAAVALAVGTALLMSGFGYEASCLAALSIAVLGFITAHNWPWTRRGRTSTVVGYVTLAVVAVISLGAIAFAVDGVIAVRNAAAQIERLSRITEADITRFATERRQHYKFEQIEPPPPAPPVAARTYDFEQIEWPPTPLGSRLAESGLTDVVSSRPGKELVTYRRALTAARLQLVVARRNVAALLWSLSATLGFVALVGVSLARTVEWRMRKSPDLRRRDRRPALMVGLVSIATFFIAISLETKGSGEVRIWRALSVAVGTGLLATAALVYRRLGPPRGHETSDRTPHDGPPTTPTTP